MRVLKSIAPGVLILIAILAISEFFFYDLSGYDWRKAKEQFPDAGKELGLEFIAPEYDYDIGKLKGVYHGYQIRVLPDEQARIEIRLKTPQQLQLATYPTHRVNPPEGMQLVESGYPAFNDFFETRFAKPTIAMRIAESRQLAQLVEGLQNNWGWQLEYLFIDESTLVVSLRYGWQSYIPAKVIVELLPDLVQLTEVLEALTAKAWGYSSDT